MSILTTLCAEFSLAGWQAENLAEMIEAGDTLPFIARYRKERHGSLDDQALRRIAERYASLKALEARRAAVEESLRGQGIADEALYAQLAAAATQAEIEDLYRPYKPKRRTRAMIAREKGLAPLAELLLSDTPLGGEPLALAVPYIDAEKGVETAEDALAGARDILAELIADDAALRRRLREHMRARGQLASRAAKEEDSVYRAYYEYAEPLSRAAGHRVLAVNRGEAEGFLRVSVAVPEAEAMDRVRSAYRREGAAKVPLEEAGQDAWRRLIYPSLEREARAELTERASEAALGVFARNLRSLLMQPPLRGATVLALDPGVRTGCKAAVVDPASRVLDTGVLYPLPAHGKVEEARRTARIWMKKYGVTAIAVGNGTASAETQAFAADLLRDGDFPGCGFVVVDEAGASVYSASELASAELPGMDVTLRGAVSLARRLQDPLAELVKIDPKSIGVGQYQHDMRAARLDEALSGVVEDCVNAVGVELNTASPALLARVAGIGPALAQNIAFYREENGPFKSRAELKKVKKLGPKAFEQCAGFLRVPGARNPLDDTAVHPESYAAAQKLVDLLFGSGKLIRSEVAGRAAEYPPEDLAAHAGVGIPTMRDILEELAHPGRDPRAQAEAPELRSRALSIDELAPGMELRGVVRNVTDFGAFVDIGVHRDGLVHISRMGGAGKAALSAGQTISVVVLEADKERNRISLGLAGKRDGTTAKA